jgi:hypothetical protein
LDVVDVRALQKSTKHLGFTEFRHAGEGYEPIRIEHFEGAAADLQTGELALSAFSPTSTGWSLRGRARPALTLGLVVWSRAAMRFRMDLGYAGADLALARFFRI